MASPTDKINQKESFLNKIEDETCLGTRKLNEEEIKHLETLLTGTIERHPDNTTYALAQILQKEDIQLDHALKIGEILGLNPKIIYNTYHKLLTDNEKQTPTISEILIKDNCSPEQSQKIELEIKKTIAAPKHHGMIISKMGSDMVAGVDPKTKQIFFETLNIKNNRDNSREIIVAGCYPMKVTVYDSPLSEEDIKYEILYDGLSLKRPRRYGPDIVEEHINYLRSQGLIKSNRHIQDVLPAILQEYTIQGISVIKSEIETPGYFYDTRKHQIISVKQPTGDPKKEELIEAFEVLDLLHNWFKDQSDKLATCIKWGLIAPFSFAIKQIGGDYLPWLYLYGRARSGKTTMAHIVTYLHAHPNDQNDLSGDSFSTVARIGEKLSQSTLPIIVNEPAGVFNRISNVEIIKSSIESPSSRGKIEGRRYKTIPAYAAVVFTANHYVPSKDAVVRRFQILSFSHSEKKDSEEMKEFEKTFHIKNPRVSLLNKLKPLAQFVANEIIHDPDLLEEDWKELINTLLVSACSDADIKYPDWLRDWGKSETMDDLDNENVEEIRMFLLERVNKEYGRVQVVDEDYRPVEETLSSNISNSDDFRSRVWQVVNNRLIPWMVPVNTRGKDYICFTSGFKMELHKTTQVCQPLKSVAELLGWKYQTERMPNPTMVMKVSLDKFLEFLYPGGVK